MTIQEQLNQVFQMVFDDPAIQINPEMTADDVVGWDSLSHVNLMVAVESTFGIRFGQREILTFKNVGDLLRSIECKLAS